MSVQLLVQVLQTIQTFQIPNSYDTVLNNVYREECNTKLDEDYKSFISYAVGLAESVLIDNNGQCAWDNHEILDDFGFHVFPGERDRFGWLTGCIQTTKGILVYG